MTRPGAQAGSRKLLVRVQGKSYRGTVSTTATGVQCAAWADVGQWDPEKYPNEDLQSNFCRNPSSGDGAWCYTGKGVGDWGLCDIPVCEVTPASDFVDTSQSCQKRSDEVCEKQRSPQCRLQIEKI